MNHQVRRWLSVCLLGGASLSAVAATVPATEALQAAVNSPHRLAADVARDAARHPVETLQFFQIEPHHRVVEVWPGAGWYTDILAPYLRGTGQLVAAQVPPDEPGAEPSYRGRMRTQYEAKLAAQPTVFDRVRVVTFDPRAGLSAVPTASVDRVVTFRSVHNWWMRGGGEPTVVRALAHLHRVLVPGGLLGVVDHRLPASLPQGETGYLHQDFVIEAAQRAGFELVGSSEINANPRDTANHPTGVWFLPPNLRGADGADRERALAIGESDRMTLLFRKPEAP